MITKDNALSIAVILFASLAVWALIITVVQVLT